MNPWVLFFGGLGAAICILSLLDNGPLPAPPGSSASLIEWQEFLRAHKELH